MLRAYKALLQIYPPEYCEMFAHEMLDTVEGVLLERSRRGALSLLLFLFLELVNILKGALTEWIDRFTYSIYHSSSYLSRSCLPNRLLMRPAGVAREAYFFESTPDSEQSAGGDDSGMCLNVYQRFVSASPIRRLLMLTCAMLFPMHRS
ncbi:MAG TPA: hypothetical protein VKN18_09945 [Blastocatellia bacterium]|nr:hypothetical protein [Blastocatellia bacterium]